MEVGKICQVKSIENLKELSDRLNQKDPDLHLLSKIQKRLASLRESVELNPTTTQAIAVSLQCPAHINGLQAKDPSFEAWKQASYEFLYQEFGKENLVYLHLNQEKPAAAIHCIFVPIKSNQLVPQAFLGTSAQEEGYINRYQAILDRLLKQTRSQSKDLQTTRASQQGLRPSYRAAVQLPFQEDKRNYYSKVLNDKQNGRSIEDYMLGRGHREYEADPGELSRKSASIHVPNQRQDLDKPVKDPAYEERYAQDKLYKFSSDEDAKTYLEQRGIEPATYQGIQGMKTNHRGAIFGLYRKVGIQKGQGELCALEHYPKDNREIDKDLRAYLPSGLSVFRPSEEVKEIVITGNPIGALCHKELHKDKAERTLYLSTCGHLTKDIARNLEEIFLQAREQRVVIKLSFDSDERGKNMAEKVEAMASKQGVTCQIEWPSKGSKDWNEMLIASKQQLKQIDLPKPTPSLGRGL